MASPPSFTKRQKEILRLLSYQEHPVSGDYLSYQIGATKDEARVTCETLIRRGWIEITETLGETRYRLGKGEVQR